MWKKTLPLIVGIGLIAGAASLAFTGCSAKPKTTTEAADSMLGKTVTCPVNGERFTITKNTPTYEYEGKRYYFCCEACVPQFKAEPQKYVGNRSMVVDPVCGMEIDSSAAISYDYNGQAYYFDSDACKAKFVAEPQKYMQVMHQGMQERHPQ